MCCHPFGEQMWYDFWSPNPYSDPNCDTITMAGLLCLQQRVSGNVPIISYSLKGKALQSTLKDGSFRLFPVNLRGLGHD